MENKNIIIINRWSDNFADYCQLLNHFENNVFYITNKNGANYLSDKKEIPHKLYEIENLQNEEEIKRVVTQIVESYGKVDIVVAMSEFDLLIAAKIREAFHIEGMDLNTTLNFTDKVAMKKTLRANNVACPAFIEDLLKIDDFIEEHGFPIVLKPCQGASSRGVMVVRNKEELEEAKKSIENEPYECEKYIEGPIIHVDGIVQKNQITFQKASRYVNTCYEYLNGTPVGSIIITDTNLLKELTAFTESVIENLGLINGVFHMEAFLVDEKPIFLEIGARQGGGEVVPLMKYLYNVDLIEAFFNTQIGLPVEINKKETNKTGGFLLIPEPSLTPCIVKKVTDMKKVAPTLEVQILPEIGSVLDGQGGYYFNSGRFLFIGTETEIETDILNIINNFSIITEPITELVK